MDILLLEDDPLLNEIIDEFLTSKNYIVKSIFDGEEALESVYENSFDLLILDVNVPSMDGFELSKTLKKNNIDIPTIFITSRHTPKDVEKGFKAGADDYIKKPFNLSELNIRIENIKRLRKIESHGNTILNKNISYNYDSKTIISFEKEFILSKMEVKVFEYLLKNKNKVLSIDEISLNNWLYDEMPIATTIRTYIKNLRKILGKDMITTIKGVGYKLNC
jgi:DNA-binding response OmpR family regulator